MPIPQLRHPIVLIHGFCGFERLQFGGLTLANYFPGIVDLLRQAGNRVLVPWLSPTEGVVQRAVELRNFLDQHCSNEPVHLIAHSMGGLDARYMISRLQMGPHRVLTLTTLGAPHRGTPFADWGICRLERLLKPVFQLLHIPTQGFYDLTTSNCRDFNRAVLDVSGVRYFSIAGRHEGDFARPEWLLPHSIVYESEGPNDGVVSIASATWGERLDVWPCDHLSMINWPGALGWNDGRGTERFIGLIQRLANEGY